MCVIFGLVFFFSAFDTTGLVILLHLNIMNATEFGQDLYAGNIACTILLLVTLHLSDSGVRKHFKDRIHVCQPQHRLSLCFHILKVYKCQGVAHLVLHGPCHGACPGLQDAVIGKLNGLFELFLRYIVSVICRAVLTCNHHVVDLVSLFNT